MAIFAAVGATEQTALVQVGGDTSGGGGGTVIPDGGTISGLYEGDVLCAGDVTMTGPVSVAGNLIVLGDFENTGGHDLAVRGDFNARYVDIQNSDTSQPNGNITVDGDFWFYWLNYIQSGTVARTLRVGGDLIGSAGFVGSPIFAYGLDDTNGADILVYGDLKCTFVEMYGGNSNLAVAGRGGYLTVWGNVEVLNYINAYGGEANNTTFDAGYGGHIEVYGSLVTEDISARGGYALEGNAGDGGLLEVDGNVACESLQLSGGSCDSDSNLHRSGTAGNISVIGNLVVNGSVNLNGGTRNGALTLTNFLLPPDAGIFSVVGSVVVDGDLNARGGSINTNLSLGVSGHGGLINIEGNLNVTDDVEAYGGSSSNGQGGDGGSCNVEGFVYVDDDFEFFGGGGLTGGGNGGTIDIESDANLGYVITRGGDSDSGIGGYGGTLFIGGDLTVDDFLSLDGGDSGSTDSSHTAGSSGEIYVSGNATLTCQAFLRGGARYGATTSPNTGASPPNGGYFETDGNLTVDTLDLSGGGVSTDYPHSVGGSSGNLEVRGSLVCYNELSINGGNAVGNNGGVAGNILVNGPATFRYLYARGGDANNSVLGGDAGANGSAPFNLQFRRGGVSVQDLQALDGSGSGSVPSANVQIILGGHSTFGTMNVVDRAQVRISADSQFGGELDCTLKIRSMPTKQTLNNADGTATGNINANLDDSIFTSNATGWCVITGTPV